MDTTKYTRGRYFKGEDVKTPTLLTITTVEEGRLNDEDRLIVFFKETAQAWPVPKSIIPRLHEWFSPEGSKDAQNWVGKQVELYFEPEVYMSGKRVGGVRVRQPK